MNGRFSPAMPTDAHIRHVSTRASYGRARAVTLDVSEANSDNPGISSIITIETLRLDVTFSELLS